ARPRPGYLRPGEGGDARPADPGGAPAAARRGRDALRLPHRQGTEERGRGGPAHGRLPLPDQAVRTRRFARADQSHSLGRGGVTPPVLAPGAAVPVAPAAEMLSLLQEV